MKVGTWRASLDIDEELPEYQTKTGRTRKRKSLIGNLQGVHDTLTGIVDVAMIRSLKKKDGFHPMLKEYAQVYFDECHHAASDSAIEVLQEINAKYVYGVTATPKRGGGKEKINEFLLDPIRYSFFERKHLAYTRKCGKTRQTGRTWMLFALNEIVTASTY